MQTSAYYVPMVTTCAWATSALIDARLELICQGSVASPAIRPAFLVRSLVNVQPAARLEPLLSCSTTSALTPALAEWVTLPACALAVNSLVHSARRPPKYALLAIKSSAMPIFTDQGASINVL